MGKKKEKIKIIWDFIFNKIINIIWDFIFNTTFNIIICCLLLIGVLYFGITEKYQAMWGIAASFAFIIFIFNIEKFEELKIGEKGIELKRKIEEADETLNILKDVTSKLISIGVFNLTKYGFLDWDEKYKREELVYELIKLKNSLKIDNKLMDEYIDSFFHWQLNDLIQNLCTLLLIEAEKKYSKNSEAYKEIDSYNIKALRGEKITQAEIWELYNKYELPKSVEIEKLFSEYMYYLENKKLKK